MGFEKKRVVVTGIGGVTPLGNNFMTTWEAIKHQKNGVGPLTKCSLGEAYAVRVAAEVKDFDPTQWVDAKELRRMDLTVHYGLIAALEAVRDAGLKITENNAHRIGVWIGSGMGGFTTIMDQHQTLLTKGPRRVSPFFVPMAISDMVSGQVAIYTGAQGPNGCTVTACASGTNSIGEAFEKIQLGKAEAMIAGGAEAPINDLAISGFHNMKALSTNPDPEAASRPFDANRDGFVIGEGAGILVLEELEHARSRNARIYAEIVGYGTSGDAYHITAPDPAGKGSYFAMKNAMEDAGLVLQNVDYINSHGTSTPLNDKLETKAIKHLFNEHANHLAISSTKSMTGHMLGAAGGIEAGITAMSLYEGVIPSTIHYQHPEEECDLDYVTEGTRKKNIHVALSNSLGFGGHNATLALRVYQ